MSVHQTVVQKPLFVTDKIAVIRLKIRNKLRIKVSFKSFYREAFTLHWVINDDFIM